MPFSKVKNWCEGFVHTSEGGSLGYSHDENQDQVGT